MHAAGAVALLALTTAAAVVSPQVIANVPDTARTMTVRPHLAWTDGPLILREQMVSLMAEPVSLPPSPELRAAEADRHLRESITSLEREVREWRASRRGR